MSLAIICMLEEQIIIYPTPSQKYPIITIRYPCYKDRVPASNKPSINNVIKTGRTQRILQTLLSQSELFFSLTAAPDFRPGLRVGALTGRRPVGLSSLTLGFFSLTAVPRCRAGLRVGALTGRRARALSTQMGLGPSRSGKASARGSEDNQLRDNQRRASRLTHFGGAMPVSPAAPKARGRTKHKSVWLHQNYGCARILVEPDGIEPTTYWLQTSRSPN